MQYQCTNSLSKKAVGLCVDHTCGLALHRLDSSNWSIVYLRLDLTLPPVTTLLQGTVAIRSINQHAPHNAWIL